MDGTVLLADYAQVHGGKLNVVGAGINLISTRSAEAPHMINIFAAILIVVPWQAHNQAHKIKVSLVDEDGRPVVFAEAAPGIEMSPEDEGSVVGQFNAGRSAIMQPGEGSIIPLAVPIQVEVPHLGTYRVSLEVDGTELAYASFRVLYGAHVGAQ